jgi:hypothetical protein
MCVVPRESFWNSRHCHSWTTSGVLNPRADLDVRTLKCKILRKAPSSVQYLNYILLSYCPAIAHGLIYSCGGPWAIKIISILTLQTPSRSQSQRYVTTDGQSASLSWNKAPTIWGLRPDFYYCLTVTGFLMWGALSDERTGLSFARVTVKSSKSAASMYNLHFACY